MCGICGKYNFGTLERVTKEELKKMNDLLVHRGPDDEGYYIDENFGFAMRRLSIIDLSTGRQPISNENGTIWVIFNGEIYNFQDLRKKLLEKGHKFKTKSDTETIIHLYEENGLEFVKELRGMFAIGLWDKNKKRLVLARDRIGKKPLFYALNSKYLAFASELRSILTINGISRDIEYQAIDIYLTLQYIPSPLTIFKSIRKLEPASMLVLENGQTKIEKYWDLPVESPSSPPFVKGEEERLEEAKKTIYDKLLEATRIRLISDVPLGAFLSGGIDSSIIVALMAQSSSEPVKTFSIGFKEQEFSELGYAREVAKMYGTNHTEFIVEAKMTDILPKLVWHYCEPYADSSALPSYFVSKETRKAVTVALNGDGGDENFGGYLRYVAMKLAYFWNKVPLAARKLVLQSTNIFPEKTAPFNLIWKARKFLKSTLTRDFSSTYLGTVSFFKTEEKNELLTDEFKNLLGSSIDGAEKYISNIFEKTKKQDYLNKLIYVDFKSYLPECLMTKMDIASMANSLETRSPFLDHKVIEYVYTLPGKWKLRGINQTKWILKETFKNMLPPKIYKRGKMGFGIPLGPWFRGELKDLWYSTCMSEKAISRGYFNKESLLKLWNEHQSQMRDHGYRMWAILMLELWHQQFHDDFKL